MTGGRSVAVLLVLLLGLVGCTEDPSPAAGGEQLTWQEAKARTQAMELDIAASLPQDKVAEVDQSPTGVLMECGDSWVNWHGATTVTLREGTDPEPLVRELKVKYQDSRFKIEIRDPAPAGHYELGLASSETAEIYLIGAGFDPYTIRIASGSECFPWPEDEYMGGDF